jgi:Na+-translocating ferredoxin:NAD+ oxidoreductase subunit E
MKKQVTLSKEYLKGLMGYKSCFQTAAWIMSYTCSYSHAGKWYCNGTCNNFCTCILKCFISSVKNLFHRRSGLQLIVVIASFVTVADLVMKAKFPEISKALVRLFLYCS